MERMRKIGLLVLISFLLALIICLPLFNKWLNVLLRVSETERKNNKGITFSIQHEDNPLNKELQDFAALYNALIENQKEGYKYYEIYSQYLENFSEQKEFYSAISGELENQCSAIDCIQISKNVIDDFHIKILKGSSLLENDFILKKENEIPILMGNLYSSIYKLEDTFIFTYLYDDYTFKVVGFLEKGSQIDSFDYPIDLDKYIVMPSFTIEDNVEITDGLKIHYANKTSGIIEVLEDNKEIFYSFVRPLLENADVFITCSGDFTEPAPHYGTLISIRNTDTDVLSPLDGVTMEVTECSDISVTVRIVNDTDKDIQCGEDFCLEVQDEETGEWRKLDEVIDNAAFNAIAYMVQKDSPYEAVIDFEWLYGKLEPGRYRIVKTVTDFRGTGDFTDYTFTAEFSI